MNCTNVLNSILKSYTEPNHFTGQYPVNYTVKYWIVPCELYSTTVQCSLHANVVYSSEVDFFTNCLIVASFQQAVVNRSQDVITRGQHHNPIHHCTVDTAHFTVHIVSCTLYIAHFTLLTAGYLAQSVESRVDSQSSLDVASVSRQAVHCQHLTGSWAATGSF